MVHGRDLQALKIRDVAWNVEGEDLPPSVAEELVTAGPAAQKEATLRGLAAIAHDVLPRV